MRSVCWLSLLLLLSGSVVLGQSNPIPWLSNPLMPARVLPGSAAFRLTVNGAGFTAQSVVQWNHNSRTTRFVSRSQLLAQIPATDVASPGSASVTVVNPAPGGGTSNGAFLQVSQRSTLSFRVSGDPAGFETFAVVTGDFNQDGKLDMAAANAGGTISTFLGNGDGTFQSQHQLTAGMVPVCLVVGDFNGDSLQDIAAVNYGGVKGGPGTISLFLGNGDGTFQPVLTSSAGLGPYSIVAGDFNRDGKLDLAVAEYNNVLGNQVGILLGNGDGTFQPLVSYTTGKGPSVVITGDFNRDGKLDLITSNRVDNDVSVLLGNGDGTFQAHVDYATGYDSFLVASADLNGDNIPDLAVIDGTGNPSYLVSVLLGKGDGSFQPAVNYSIGQGPTSLAIADLNGDNHQDLAVVVASRLLILLGAGDGTFTHGVDQVIPTQTQGVAVGDFNHDGRFDLAIAGVFSDQVTVLQQITPASAPLK